MPSPNRRDKDQLRSQWQDDAPVLAPAIAYDQPRFRAPRGYSDDTWMVARNFEAGGKYHGHSLSQGLPILHDIVHGTVAEDMTKAGWPYLVNRTIGMYWERYASRKPEHTGFPEHWAELYPALRDKIEDRPSAAALAALARRQAELREDIESGKTGIVRRQRESA